MAALLTVMGCTQDKPTTQPIQDIEGISCEDTAEYVPTLEEIEDSILTDMAMAFAYVESRCNPAATSKVEDAAGLLQIKPSMVAECNRLSGYERFCLSDRYDSELSVCMFEIVMRERNPELDIHTACDVWNPGCGKAYRNAVVGQYMKITQNTPEQ